MFQFDSSVTGEKLPVNVRLPIVPVLFPSGNMAVHGFKVRNAPIQALPDQGTQFDLRHVEPAAVFGRVVDFKALGQPSASCGSNV